MMVNPDVDGYTKPQITWK